MKVSSLTLQNFRQFEKKNLHFDKSWTVLVAPNARGKSTLIEALFLLATGQSPWTTQNTNMIISEKNTPPKKDLTWQDKRQEMPTTKQNSQYCRVEGEIENTDESKILSLYIQDSNGAVTKQYKIDGQPTIRSKFTRSLHAILFSPDLIDTLMFEPKQRRDFLDLYISETDQDYEQMLLNFYKVLRQRNSLLKSLAGKRFSHKMNHPSGITEDDKTNLAFWTEQLLDLGTQVMGSRIEFINKLNSIKSKLYPGEIAYLPRVKLAGMEDLISSSEIYKFFRQQLESISEKELLIGQTLTGPHRDDWHLYVNGKDLNDFGSRGEKRMAIADIIFKINLLLTEILGEKPVLLLDDIPSELDEENIRLLFKKKLDREQQVILTTTNINMIPEFGREISQVILLE